MNVLLLLSHAVEEYDQVKLLSGLGYDVFSIGAYSEPANPGVMLRPAIPEAPDHPDLRDACQARREEMEALHGSPRNRIDWAKFLLPDAVLEWADTIICHHFEHTWLVPQWERLRDHRVIWRTVGQSTEYNETMMAPYRAAGLQIVRYSPNEQHIPGYAGEDALIRFYKDPDEWSGWTGEDEVAIHLAQHTPVARERDRWINFPFFEAVTEGFPSAFAGSHSELAGGMGELSYDEMRAFLRRSRVYIYTGTQPASYTLGLLEAMMTGIPVVSITPQFMDIFPYGPLLFEGADIAGCSGAGATPEQVIRNTRDIVGACMGRGPGPYSYATGASKWVRKRAIATFGREVVGAAWRDFLG
jgi:hypothetical protein